MCLLLKSCLIYKTNPNTKSEVNSVGIEIITPYLINVLKDNMKSNIIFNEINIANKLNSLDAEYENLGMYEETDNFVVKLKKYKDEHQRHSTNKSNKQSRIQFLKEWLNDCR